MNYAFFVHLRATPVWLSLSREQRRGLSEKYVAPALQAQQGRLTMRLFDAEAFSAPCSDVLMTETTDPQVHYFFMEHLRDSPLLAAPYFEIMQITATIEDGFQAYERMA